DRGAATGTEVRRRRCGPGDRKASCPSRVRHRGRGDLRRAGRSRRPLSRVVGTVPHTGQRRADLDGAREREGRVRFSLPPSRGKGRGWGGERQLTPNTTTPDRGGFASNCKFQGEPSHEHVILEPLSGSGSPPAATPLGATASAAASAV